MGDDIILQSQHDEQEDKIFDNNDNHQEQVLMLSYSTCSITKRTKKKLPSFDSIPKTNKREMKKRREGRQMMAALTGTVGGFVLAGPFGAIAVGMGGAYVIKKMHVLKERREVRRYMQGEIILKRLK